LLDSLLQEIKMAPKKPMTWCNSNAQFELTWPISKPKDSSGQDSGNIKIPFKTDITHYTVWSMSFSKNDRKKRYYILLFGELFSHDVTVKANFSITDKDGKTKEIGSDVVLEVEEGWSPSLGWKNGKSDDFTLDSDGPITINCQLSIELINAEKTNDKLHGEMEEMLINAKEYHSDVVMKCTDGQVDCHKSILCLKSSYFKNMFESRMKEAKSGKIPISLDKESCLVLLKYLYTGKLDSSKVTVELLTEVDKMLMQDFKEMCLKDLGDNINMQNVVKILEMTDKVEAKDLQKAAEQFIVENRKDLTPELKQELRGYSNFESLMFKIIENYL